MNTYDITRQDMRYMTLSVKDLTGHHASHSLRLPINPSLKQLDHDIRTTPIQTEGGIWVDDFGMGMPQLQLQGNTGWRPVNGRYNGTPIDGFQAFVHMYQDIIQYYFQLESLYQTSPDNIELLIADDVDRVTYRAIPTNKISWPRTRSTPLLFPYSATFIIEYSNVAQAAIRKKAAKSSQIATAADIAKRSSSVVARAQARTTTIRQAPIRYYVVQSGDTMWSIAQQFYGDGSLADYLAQQNHIPNANLIYVGETLMIPYR